MLVGQPSRDSFDTFGASFFQKVGSAVKKAHTVPTKALVKALKNPNVQRAAAASAQQYAQQKYPGQYAQGVAYAQQAKAILRPPGPQVPTGPMAPMEEMAEEAPMPGPVQKGNFTTIALIGGAALLLIVMMKK